MKRQVKLCLGLWLFIAYCLFSTYGLTEMGPPLPDAVARVFKDPGWEGYQPVVTSGYGGQNSQNGQYAVLMKKGDHNVLCIVEKDTDDTEFAITVRTDKAVYQGDLLPRLLIDTGGDALFFSYGYDQGPVRAERLSVFKSNGSWGTVSRTLCHPQQEGRYPETSLFAHRNVLTIDTLWSDGNDNILERGEEQRIKGVPTALSSIHTFDISSAPRDYESAMAQYGGNPYATKLFFSQAILIHDSMPPVVFELWGTEGEPRMMDEARITESGILQQEIPLGLELYTPAESAVLFADANFDGYLDLMINRSTGAYNAYYDYWIWDANANQFGEFALYSALEASPTFDPETRQIHSFTKDGAAHSFECVYQVWEGLPELLAQYELVYESEAKRTVTLWQYVDNTLTAVDEWIEDAPFVDQLGAPMREETLH